MEGGEYWRQQEVDREGVDCEWDEDCLACIQTQHRCIDLDRVAQDNVGSTCMCLSRGNLFPRLDRKNEDSRYSRQENRFSLTRL